MNSIESFSQNTDAKVFTMSAFNTFFIIIHDNIQTETEEAVMTEYHWKIIKNIDLFNSAEMIVRRYNDEKEKK